MALVIDKYKLMYLQKKKGDSHEQPFSQLKKLFINMKNTKKIFY